MVDTLLGNEPRLRPPSRWSSFALERGQYLVATTIGTNELIGAGAAGIPAALERGLAGIWKHGGIPERGDGQTGLRMVDVLERLLQPGPDGDGGASLRTGRS